MALRQDVQSGHSLSAPDQRSETRTGALGRLISMPERHTGLIVEDERDMAAEIADLLRSFGHDHLHAETLADAKARLDEGGFCYVLLDLQIKADGQSIKPRVEFGMSLLREIRRRFPHRSDNDMHLMPVLVISGHGKEPNNIIGAFKDGIDDFIMKPLSTDGQDVGPKPPNTPSSFIPTMLRIAVPSVDARLAPGVAPSGASSSVSTPMASRPARVMRSGGGSSPRSVPW